MLEIEMELTPSLENIKRWINALESEVLNDLTTFWDDFATPALIEEIARIFATEGYGTWPPLSPQYERWKSKYYPGLKMLRRKGEYYKAATERGNAGNVYERDKDSMSFGVDLGHFASINGFPYPAAMEKGTKDGRIPARPVFGTAEQSQVLENNLVAALKKYLDKTIQKETMRHFGTRR